MQDDDMLPAVPADFRAVMKGQQTLWQADWREGLSRLADESVDLVITDPPYLQRWEGIGTTTRMGLGRKGSRADDPDKSFPTVPNRGFSALLDELYRVLRPQTHCYVMSDAPTLPYLFGALGEDFCCPDRCIYKDDIRQGWTHWKLLVWDKGAPGMGYHYRAQHEYILLLDKGSNRGLADRSVPDVLRFSPPRGAEKLYPTQKPLALFELLVRQSSAPGELVLDPFVGSGTTIVAAQRLGRRGLGMDVYGRAIEVACGRLEQLLGQPRLDFAEQQED